MEGTLFALDRSTFRYTLARSSTAKHRAVYEALSNVSLLKVFILIYLYLNIFICVIYTYNYTYILYIYIYIYI